MNHFQSYLFTSILFLFSLTLLSQETYMAAAEKQISLIDTKYLKDGNIVLIQKVRYCDRTKIVLLKPDKTVESILYTGTLVYHKFNELPNNNWVLVMVTDNFDDYPVPLKLHTIKFIDGDISIFTIDDEQTEIDLTTIDHSAVINTNELVLVGGLNAYFTDFSLNIIEHVTLEKSISLFKSSAPEIGFLYYRYSGENTIKITHNKFEHESILIINLGAQFRDIHFMGDFAIYQSVNEIIAEYDSYGYFYIEQGKKIYNFRQQGQNLNFYTISDESILTFKKISLNESNQLEIDSINIDLNNSPIIQNLQWDSNLLGYTFYQRPLSPDLYEDQYRGYNYIFDYNLEDTNLSTQTHDVSIDEIQHTIIPVSENYIDISLNITLTNHSDEPIWDVHLHSAAFEGINCANNALKVTEDMIAIGANSSVTVEARYESMYVENNISTQPSLCVYVIGANNKFDENFEDNIFCLNLSEILSTEDQATSNALKAYPNPASEYLRIDHKRTKSSFKIYNGMGGLVKKVKISSEHKISIAELAPGSYFLVEDNTGLTTVFTKI